MHVGSEWGFYSVHPPTLPTAWLTLPSAPLLPIPAPLPCRPDPASIKLFGIGFCCPDPALCGRDPALGRCPAAPYHRRHQAVWCGLLRIPAGCGHHQLSDGRSPDAGPLLHATQPATGAPSAWDGRPGLACLPAWAGVGWAGHTSARSHCLVPWLPYLPPPGHVSHAPPASHTTPHTTHSHTRAHPRVFLCRMCW